MAIGTVGYPQPENFSSYRSPADSFMQGINSSLDMMNRMYATRNEPQRLAAALANLQQQTRQKQIENQYMAREKEGNIMKTGLANQLSRLTMPYEVPKIQAGIANTQATTANTQADTARLRFNLLHPLLSLTGVAGQLGAQSYLEEKERGNTIPSQNQPSPLPSNVPGQPQPLPVPSNVQNANIAQKLGDHLTFSDKDIENYKKLQQGNPSSKSSILAQAIASNQAAKQARTELDKKKTAGYDWSKTPPDVKATEVAFGNAFGFSPDETVRRLNSGEKLTDLGKEAGFGDNPKRWAEEGVIPIFNPTAADRSRINTRRAAVSEIKYLDDFMTDSLGSYPATYRGYSPQQILDTAKEKFGLSNPKTHKQLVKFFAGQMLLPDYLGARGKTVGLGTLGIQALQELKDASIARRDFFHTTLTPELFKEASQMANKGFVGLAQAANKEVSNPIQGDKEQQPTLSSEINQSEERINLIGPHGEHIHVPSRRLNEFLSEGWKKV